MVLLPYWLLRGRGFFVDDIVLVVAVGHVSDQRTVSRQVVGTEEDRLAVPQF